MKFFKNSKDGKIAIQFSENEIIVAIDLLEFMGKLCQTLSDANIKGEDHKTADSFRQRAMEAIALSDKLIEASNPDRAEEVLH